MAYLDTADVCEMLKIDRKKAYKLFKLKGFPCIKIGRDYRVEEQDLKKFLDYYKSTTIFLN